MDDGAVADEVAAGRSARRGPACAVVARTAATAVPVRPTRPNRALRWTALELLSDTGYAVSLGLARTEIGHRARQPDRTRPAHRRLHLFLLDAGPPAADRRSLISPGLCRFLHRWPRGRAGAPFRRGTTFPTAGTTWPGRSGGRLELYVDGVPTRPVTSIVSAGHGAAASSWGV